MPGLGDTLRIAREQQGITLASAAATTGIHIRYLEALEDEYLEILPARVYARLYLRSYAEMLGLDPTPLLEDMDVFWLEEGEPEPKPVSSQSSMPVITGQTLLIVLVIALIAVLLAFVYVQYSAFMSSSNGLTATDGTPIAGSIAAAGGKPSLKLSPTVPIGPVQGPPPPSTPLPTMAPTVVPTPAGMNLEIRITQTAWVNVEVDGKEALNATLQPGAIHSWTAKEKIFIWTGFAGGVRVYRNGVDEGQLGSGVMRVQWTAPTWRATTLTDGPGQ
jgi:cytoskeleton protein RodZ